MVSLYTRRTVILFGIFRKLPFPIPFGKYLIKIWKIRAKIHEIGKIKAIFGLGMTLIYNKTVKWQNKITEG